MQIRRHAAAAVALILAAAGPRNSGMKSTGRDLREVSVFPDCAKENEKRYCGRDPQKFSMCCDID
jgi:hypothetical protein